MPNGRVLAAEVVNKRKPKGAEAQYICFHFKHIVFFFWYDLDYYEGATCAGAFGGTYATYFIQYLPSLNGYISLKDIY
jgi:hypothetical protein